MATQLVVRYEHTDHRFVKTTKVQVVFTGPPEPEVTGSRLGHHIFDISPLAIGNTFKLTIEIPVPPVMTAAGLTAPPLMLIEQLVEVFDMGKGIVSLRPHPTNPGNRFRGAYHPRLEGHLVKSGGGHIYYIEVDNTFLKVNRIAGAANPGFVAPYLASKPIVPGAVNHYGCRLNLYEYTGGRANLWPVLIPPAVKDSTKNVHALLFFRPASSKPYNTIEDADSASIMRYLLDPDPAAPFFVDPRKPSRAKIEIISNCGFERSLSQSDKPLILLSPNPHGGDYGHAASSIWPKLIKSMLIALWAENDIGQKVDHGLVLGRTAVGGFSFGGLQAFNTVKVQPNALDELYLFDCREFTVDDQNNVKSWFAKGGKKLRMIGGGLFHGKMLALADQLKSADASVTPANANDWLTNNLYKAAVSFHKFDPSSALGPTPGSVSDITGIFVDASPSGTGIVLEGRDRSSATVALGHVVSAFTEEEFSAAAMLYSDSFAVLPHPNGLDKEFARHKPPETPPPVPLNNRANFFRLVTAFEGRCKAIRHQWAVAGGQDSAGKTDRLSTFKGFLQLCIEQGNFP